jgi:O-antigen/teichoic acid export membrane protein
MSSQAPAIVPPRKLGALSLAIYGRRLLLVEVMTLGSGQVIGVLGAIVATRFLTGLLAPEAYGDLALAVTAAGLLNVIGSGAIGNSVGRFYAVAHERGTLRSFFRVVALLYGQYQLGVCCLAFIGLLIYHEWKPSAAWPSLAIAAIGLSLINGACVLLDAMQNAARQRLVVAWHQAAGQWLRLIGAIACIRWAGPTAASALAGYVVACLLVLGSQFLFFKLRLSSRAASEPDPESKTVREMMKEMRGFANPFVAFGSIAWLQQASDRWLLALFGSRREVGLYQTLNQVGYSPLTQLSGLISLVVAPILFFQAGDGTDDGRVHRARERVRQLSWLMFAGTLVFAGLLLLLGKPLFALVVAPEYRSAARYLPLVALAGGLFATGQMLTTDSLVQLNSRSLIAPKIGSALLAVGLNYFGARAFGLSGVVWAGVLASGAYAMWMVILVGRSKRLSLVRCGDELAAS